MWASLLAVASMYTAYRDGVHDDANLRRPFDVVPRQCFVAHSRLGVSMHVSQHHQRDCALQEAANSPR